MMLRSILRWAGLSVGAVLLVVSILSALPAAAKQAGQQAGKPAKTADTVVTATGKIAVGTTNSQKQFLLQDSSGKTVYSLKFGPPWFANSSANPLNHYVNQQVTVIGDVEQPEKDEKEANENAQPASSASPMLNIRTVNGQALRGTGRPPWAGGPKNVPGHPGSNGNGHAKGKGNGNNGSKP